MLEIIKKQTNIIEQMKIYQLQLEEILSAVVTKLGNVFNEKQFKIQKAVNFQVTQHI